MNGALVWALVAALEPLPLIAFIVVLSARRGRSSAIGFIGGWIVSAVIIAVLVGATAGNAPEDTSSAPVVWMGALQLALGVALVVLGLRRRGVPPPTDKTPPRWTMGVDRLGPLGGLAVGVLIQPWGIMAAAQVAVFRSFDSSSARVAGAVAVIVVSAAPYTVALLLAHLRPEETAARLGGIRTWMETHQRSMLNGAIWFLAAWFLLHGLGVILTVR